MHAKGSLRMPPDLAAAGGGHRAVRQVDHRRRDERLTARSPQRDLTAPSMRRLLLCRSLASFALLGFRARSRGRVPAVPVQLRDEPVQPVPLLARGRRAHHVVGARRERRHDQHGGRRRLPARARSPPSWLALGADLRLAAHAHRRRRRTRRRRAPGSRCRRDLYARFAFGDAFSLYLAGGVRGEVRPRRRLGPGARFTTASPTASSRASTTSCGARARPARTRASAASTRPTASASSSTSTTSAATPGYNLYDETYNASGGYVADDWEVHLTAFTPPPSELPRPAAVGRHARVGRRGLLREALRRHVRARGRRRASASARRSTATRAAWSASSGSSQAKLLFLGEADVIQPARPRRRRYGQNQFVSYIGATVVPGPRRHGRRRLRALPGGPLGQGDRPQRRSTWQVNFFPWAHSRSCCSAATRWSVRACPAARPPRSSWGSYTITYEAWPELQQSSAWPSSRSRCWSWAVCRPARPRGPRCLRTRST